jgi:hypothetical protein
MDLKRIERALKLLEAKEASEAAAMEQTEDLTLLQKVRQSQYWDFALYGFILIALTLLINIMYVGIEVLGKFLPVTALEKLSRLPISGLVLIFAIAFVDFQFAVFERIFFKFSKRNGINTFDYQEAFKNLTQWQQVIIYTVRSALYLFAFISIYTE